ncbi:hypothetical protein Q8A73_013253 [Channa argus]|nr:hypothetical protein Q8A73_013253 [Channa argus]
MSPQPSTLVHVNAASRNLYVPLAQLQNTNPLLQDSIIQVLRKALLSAANEIKLLKEENKALKQQRDLLENEQRQVRQLQEELKAKDELLKRETRKGPARTKAHMDTLSLPTKAEGEIRMNDKLWQDTCDAREVSLREEMANNKERWGKKVQELEIEGDLLVEEQQSVLLKHPPLPPLPLCNLHTPPCPSLPFTYTPLLPLTQPHFHPSPCPTFTLHSAPPSSFSLPHLHPSPCPTFTSNQSRCCHHCTGGKFNSRVVTVRKGELRRVKLFPSAAL